MNISEKNCFKVTILVRAALKEGLFKIGSLQNVTVLRICKWDLQEEGECTVKIATNQWKIWEELDRVKTFRVL